MYASGAVLQWIIDGAKMFIDGGYKLPTSKKVTDAIGKYREENDWLANFLDECCIVDPMEKCPGGALYKAYRAWATETGEYVRRNRDFADALRNANFEIKKGKQGNVWLGLTLSPNRSVGTTAEEDFLP